MIENQRLQNELEGKKTLQLSLTVIDCCNNNDRKLIIGPFVRSSIKLNQDLHPLRVNIFLTPERSNQFQHLCFASRYLFLRMNVT